MLFTATFLQLGGHVLTQLVCVEFIATNIQLSSVTRPHMHQVWKLSTNLKETLLCIIMTVSNLIVFLIPNLMTDNIFISLRW